MNNIMQLINTAKVEWKTLGEVGELVRGNGLPKKDFTETGVPAIHYGQIYTYYGLSTAETISFVSPETAQKLKKVNKGDVIITNTSENLEDVGKALLYLGEKQAVTGGHATIFKPDNLILGMYFVYYTQTIEFASQKRKYAKGTKVIDVSATDMAKIQIPIPPLPLQAQIVRILDTMTALTTELTTELTMREQQFKYYRDFLLSENQLSKVGFEWQTLGEIGEFVLGSGLQKKDFENTGFPAIHYGQIYTRYGLSAEAAITYVSQTLAKKLKIANNNDLLIATTSENDEDVVKPLAWLGSEVAISGDMMIFRHQQNVKYLAYYLQTDEFQFQKKKYITGTKVRRVSKGNLSKIKIPIPPLAEQARIVAILDTFDTLTTSISEGLPHEIQLRQQQYAYYRERLLGFEVEQT